MIAVLGLGYAGLTTALGFADKGFKVYGIDTNKEKSNLIASGKIPFYEKNLNIVLKKNINRNFYVANSLKECINDIKIIFICVGTPTNSLGKIKLTYLKSALQNILSVSNKQDKKLIVIKSTVPPSTTVNKVIPFINKSGFTCGKNIFVANNPEFLREGSAWNDFINQDRIIIGTSDIYSKNLLKKLYKPFNAPVHFVSFTTSEFIKYLSNSFLATLLSYSNEMAFIADLIGDIDIKSAFKLFHSDKRWFGYPAPIKGYVYPNAGFGGSCLPKDTVSLLSTAKEFGYNAQMLQNVLKINEKIKIFWADKISAELKKNSKIAVLGLSFKPDTDDVRYTPVYKIIKLLLQKGYKNITVYDPMANKTFADTYHLPVKFASSTKQAIQNCDAVILSTVWREFVQKKHLFKNKQVFDLRYAL